MNNLQEFITSAAGEFGVGEDKLRTATSGLLGMIRDEADGGDELVSALPGAGNLMAAAASAGGGGGLLGMAGKLMGGGFGQGLGVAGLIQSSGLGTDDAGRFTGMLMDFARGHAGQELVGRVIQSVPQLAKLIK